MELPRSKNVKRVSLGVLAALSATALTGCYGDKDYKFAIRCLPDQDLSVRAIEQSNYTNSYDGTVHVACEDANGTLSPVQSIQLNPSRANQSNTQTLKVTVDQYGDGWGLGGSEPKVSYDLRPGDNTASEGSSISLGEVDSIRTVKIQ